MAKQQLPTNFKDDILATQMAGKRRYRIIQNDDGTVSLEDVTDYSRVGNDFGSAQINATNMAVNESFDKNKVIDSLDDIAANESAGYAAGALAVRELNGKIFSSDFIIAQTVTLNKVTLKGGTSTSFNEDLESKIPEGYTGIGGFLCSTNSETTVWSSYTYHHSDTGHFHIYASVRNWSSKDISTSPKAFCFFVKK